jgi:hypothetical protein
MSWASDLLEKLKGELEKLLPGKKAVRYKDGRLLFYSLPNLWWTLSSSELNKMCKEMAKNGWNATFCEFNPGVSWLGDYTFPSDADALKLANSFHSVCRKYNIYVVWSYNWNNSTIAHKPESWLNGFMDQLPHDELCGFEVGEWACSRNTDTTSVAAKVVGHAVSRFPTLNINNKGCRPTSIPAGHEFSCVHLAHAKDSLPGGAKYIACTDHSLILDELGQGGRDFQKWDLPKAVAFGTDKLKRGNSAHFYHFMGVKPDYDMIKQGPAMLKAAGVS